MTRDDIEKLEKIDEPFELNEIAQKKSAGGSPRIQKYCCAEGFIYQVYLKEYGDKYRKSIHTYHENGDSEFGEWKSLEQKN
ncbi:MAG: hypothetical protein R3A45_11530 [Bdellovibrionota bacterium]